MRDYVSLEVAMKLYDRRPYSENDLGNVTTYLKNAQKNGLGVNFHPIMMEAGRSQLMKMLNDGALIVRAPELDYDVAILKTSHGNGLLGREKIRFVPFGGSIDEDQLLMGKPFKLLAMCLTGLNNIYRDQGILSGSAT